MGGQGGRSEPAFPNFCPQCGAAVTAPRCGVCLELSQLRFAAAQLEQWRDAGQLTPEHAAALRVGLQERSDAVVRGALHREPPPRQEPEEPAPPTEWQRFRQATGISWVYGLGVLFLAAAIAWLVLESARSEWGRWVLAGVLSVLAVGAVRGGWWLLEAQHLRMGGQAVLVLGGLLTPATLFALASAITGPVTAGVAAAIWAAGAALAYASTQRGRLGSQLVLGNLLASLAGVAAVQAVAGSRGAASAWFGIVAAALAAGNLAVLGRWPERDGDESHGLRRAGQVSVGLLLGAGALTVVQHALLDPAPLAATVLSGFAVGGASLAAGLLWPRPWMLYLGAALVSLAAAQAAPALGLSQSAGPLLQAMTAGGVWAARRWAPADGEALRQAAWVPLGIGGLLAAAWLLEWYADDLSSAAAPDGMLVLGAVALGLLADAIRRPVVDWMEYAAGLLASIALGALLLWPGERWFSGTLAASIGAGLAVLAGMRRGRGEGLSAVGFGWLLLSLGLAWSSQLGEGPVLDTAWAFSIAALASGGVVRWGDRRPVGWEPWTVAAMVASAGLLAAVTGHHVETQALGVATVAWVAMRGNRARSPVVRTAGLWLAGAAALGAVAEPPQFGLLALLVAQFALVDGAEESEAPAVAGGLAWLWAASVWYGADPGLDSLPWLLHAAAAAAVGAGWILAGRRHGMAAGLTILGVGYGVLGWAWWPERQFLAFGVFALLAEAAGRLGRSDEARREAAGVAVLAAAGATLLAVGWDERLDATVLLVGCTLRAAWLAVTRRLPPVAPVLLGNLTAAYVLVVWYPVDGTSAGLRFAALGLANSLLAVPARRSAAWRDALLGCGGLIGVASIGGLLPPDRNTVLGACFLGTAAVTASALRREAQWQDVGVGCYLLALVMVLYDLAEHGHPGLDPYRAIDLWLVPLGLYVVLVVERRAERRIAIRRAGVALILGSVLLSALLAVGVVHDLILLCAVAGTVQLGVERDDAVVRWAGPATFLLYVEIEVWRQRPEWGKWLLIATLIVGGVAALVAGFRQESRSRD